MIRTKTIIYFIILVITYSNLKAQETPCFNNINSSLYNNKYYLALDLLDSLESIYPNNSSIFYKKANAQRKIHRNKEAYTSINKALSLDKNNPQLLKEYGKICIASKQLNEAIQTFDTVFFHLDTLDYSIGLLLGKCYLNQKNWNEALAVYSKMQKRDTTNTYFLYKISLCLANTKRGLEAIPYLNDITRIDSNFSAAYNLLHRIYVAKNDRESALEQLNHLKRIEPNNFEHYHTAAYFHMVKNHIFLANDNFKKAIELGDPEPTTYWDNARCLYQMKFYEDAIIHFKHLELYNTRFSDFTMMADCYQKTKNSKEAISYYNKALISAVPSAFELLNIFIGKADVFIEQSNYDAALSCYQDALGHYKGISSGPEASIIVARQMADLYQNKLKQPKKALALYQQLLNEVNEYSSPREFGYYSHEINRLNEEIFFKGN